MTTPFRVLVVDDDRLSRLTTAQQLAKRGYEARAAEDGAAAVACLESAEFDAVLADLRMPHVDGLELLQIARQRWPATNVILMTAFATVETAVQAMQKGATDYLVKPFQIDQLQARLDRLRELRDARAEVAALRGLLGERDEVGGMIGRSPLMAEVFRRIRIFANHRAPVLVTGLTGTGKELVARALHHNSDRRKAPMVAIACGTIPLDLAESELFGHEKGAFTGAHQLRHGSFERADGGTVLLDDIDDLPLNIQVKLLRVLQEGTITRVGGDAEIAVDVRVIATSKKVLADSVEAGEFREDLYYRLRGLEIELPRLADRGDDVLLLAQHFLRTNAAIEKRPEAHLSVEAANVLRSYTWPGNVRELRRVMESADVLTGGGEIRPEHLQQSVPRHRRHGNGELFSLHLDGSDVVPLNNLLERFQDAVIRWALERAGGQQKRAAELLGIPRTTLQSRLTRPHD
ncbi:MAG: sigma-54 dependent transcriptional regulator [Planctomycetota bacterium]